MRQLGFAHILLILVLLVAVAGGAYFLGKNGMRPAPSVSSPVATPVSSTTPTSKETVYTEEGRSANWKTYTTAGFSVQYPPEGKGFSEYQGSHTFELWGPTQGDGQEFHDGISVSFVTGSLKGKSIKEFVSEDQQEQIKNLSGFGSVSELSPINVGSYNGFTYTTQGFGITKHIYLSNNSNQYAVITYLPNTDPQNKGYQKIIDQILSTFKFTP